MKKLNLFIPILWLGMAIYLMTVYGQIPNQVGTHYDYQGIPDQYGAKSFLWCLPLIFMLIWGLITLVIHYIPQLERNIKGKNDLSTKAHANELAMTMILVQVGVWLLFMTNIYYLAQGKSYIPPKLMIGVLVVLLIYILGLLVKRIIFARK